MGERTFRPRPTKAVVSTGVFVLIATVEAFLGDPFSGGFWAIIAMLCASQLRPSASYLRLGPDGFHVHAFFRHWYCVWRDVSVFGTARTFGAAEMVVFRLRPGSIGRAMAPVASRWLNGWDARLPDNYGHSAASMAGLLNEYRLKYGAAQQRVEADEAG